MSRLVLICPRRPGVAAPGRADLEALSARLCPDNISARPPQVIAGDGVLVGIINPMECLPTRGTSVCVGNLIEPRDDWWKPGADVPDGSYALFRSDADWVELVADMLASRTIWYVHTDELFVASTSQRAIVCLLREFQPNEEAYSWLLFSGTLGPWISWDRRIRALQGNSRLLLDRSTWTLRVSREEVPFQPVRQSATAHQAQLLEAAEYVFDHLELDLSKWILPLSGGYDSRAILLLLGKRAKLKCITWGTKSALRNKDSDACVAQRLAAVLGVDWEYLETELSDEPIDVLFNRFLVAGEGRFDNIAGYFDGFRIWKRLFESGYAGVIRGDESFGLARHMTTPLDARRHSQVVFASDFPNLASPADYGLPQQQMPPELERRENETLETWRERLYQEFRVSTGNAALTDLKCAYVELVNPFLSRRLVEQVRKIPDALRTEKVVFTRIVRAMSPNVGFAKYPAVAYYEDLLKTKRVAAFLADELDTSRSRAVLSNRLIDEIRDGMAVVAEETGRRRRSLMAMLRYYTPTWVKNVLRSTVAKRHMDLNVLACRAYMASKMHEMLSSDARALSSQRPRLDR